MSAFRKPVISPICILAALSLIQLAKCCKILVKAQSDLKMPFKLKIVLPHAGIETEEAIFTQPDQKNIMVNFSLLRFYKNY